jgi:hypothetical protein
MRAQMQGAVLRGGRSAIVPSISDALYEDTEESPTTAIAFFELQSDGETLSNMGAGANWLIGSTNGAAYECRATMLGGTTLTSGTTGSWIALSSTRRWTVQRASLGTKDAGFLLEIGLAGANSALDSATISLTATVEL